LARMAGTAQYGKGRDYWDKRYLEYSVTFFASEMLTNLKGSRAF